MLIDKSYFIGSRDVPNTNYLDASSLLENFINVRERTYLIDIMGYDLFTAFAQELNSLIISQRTRDILFGKDFINFSGRKDRWEGFIKVLESNSNPNIIVQFDGKAIPIPIAGVQRFAELESPICDYVYFYWSREKRTNTGDVGEAKPLSQNATAVTARYKMVDCWNCMVEKNCKLDEFLRVNFDVYPEYQLHTGAKELRYLLTKMGAYF